MNTLDVPVLIVGGGPVGLTSSILLSRLGVQSLLVERHRGTLDFPKGRGISTRAMEVFRQMGLEEAIAQVGLPREDSLHVYSGETLTSPQFRRGPWGDQRTPHSPTCTLVCSQERLEPVLRAGAESLAPGGARFSTELKSLTQDANGATAELIDRESGAATAIRAAYVIAADGARSTVREILGIPMNGPAALSHQVSILFEANLGTHVADRRSVMYNVANTYVRGIFLAVDNADRWIFTTAYHPIQGQSPADFDEPRCVEIIRLAAGLPNLDVRYIADKPWEPAAQMAGRFREGRIFMAGDSAHLTTPFGGFGMSCGIQDAHNLAWKLAWVTKGIAGDDLLASYEAERRPVCQWTVDESVRNMEIAIAAARDPSDAAQQRHHERRFDAGLVLGSVYESSVIIPDGTNAPAVGDRYREYAPTARPGHRAPHMTLVSGGKSQSTLDLFGSELVVLAGRSGDAWCAAAAKLGGPVRWYQVAAGSNLSSLGDWQGLYGIDDGGAVSVRPDGHVAWRSRTASSAPETELRRVIAQCLGRA